MNRETLAREPVEFGISYCFAIQAAAFDVRIILSCSIILESFLITIDLDVVRQPSHGEFVCPPPSGFNM